MMLPYNTMYVYGCSTDSYYNWYYQYIVDVTAIVYHSSCIIVSPAIVSPLYVAPCSRPLLFFFSALAVNMYTVHLSLPPLGYSAPMEVYKYLNSHELLSLTEQSPETTEFNVCVGKEWHHFPSSFFLPNKK